MSSVNTDPVAGIRRAVASGMVSIGMQPDKELIDAVVDHLPDFFKQPLRAVEPTGEDQKTEAQRERQRADRLQKAIDEIETQRERLQQMYDEFPGSMHHYAAETILDALDGIKEQR